MNDLPAVPRMRSHRLQKLRNIHVALTFTSPSNTRQAFSIGIPPDRSKRNAPNPGTGHAKPQHALLSRGANADERGSEMLAPGPQPRDRPCDCRPAEPHPTPGQAMQSPSDRLRRNSYGTQAGRILGGRVGHTAEPGWLSRMSTKRVIAAQQSKKQSPVVSFHRMNPPWCSESRTSTGMEPSEGTLKHLSCRKPRSVKLHRIQQGGTSHGIFFRRAPVVECVSAPRQLLSA